MYNVLFLFAVVRGVTIKLTIWLGTINMNNEIKYNLYSHEYITFLVTT